jgi:DNA-binding winged helix-turn-helix (wHTH) protein
VLRPSQIVRFGPFEVDLDEQQLKSGSDVFAMTGKIDLLSILVRHPGRTSSKSELLNLLSPGIVVEEGNLSQTVFLWDTVRADVRFREFLSTIGLSGELKMVASASDTGAGVWARR